METIEYAMDIHKEKTFDDALAFAIEKRKKIILQAYAEAKRLLVKKENCNYYTQQKTNKNCIVNCKELSLFVIVTVEIVYAMR